MSESEVLTMKATLHTYATYNKDLSSEAIHIEAKKLLGTSPARVLAGIARHHGLLFTIVYRAHD